jgi:hypothetical protein
VLLDNCVTPTNHKFGTVITWRSVDGIWTRNASVQAHDRQVLPAEALKSGASLAHSNSQRVSFEFRHTINSVRYQNMPERRRSDAGPVRDQSAPFGLRNCEAMATCRTGLFLAAAKGTPMTL